MLIVGAVLVHLVHGYDSGSTLAVIVITLLVVIVVAVGQYFRRAQSRSLHVPRATPTRSRRVSVQLSDERQSTLATTAKLLLLAIHRYHFFMIQL